MYWSNFLWKNLCNQILFYNKLKFEIFYLYLNKVIKTFISVLKLFRFVYVIWIAICITYYSFVMENVEVNKWNQQKWPPKNSKNCCDWSTGNPCSFCVQKIHSVLCSRASVKEIMKHTIWSNWCSIFKSNLENQQTFCLQTVHRGKKYLTCS